MLHKTMTALTLALAALAMQATAALAHPHVWVTSKSEVVFAEDGSATGVRHHWTFDEMFSTFATQGLDAKKPGGLTRDDLASLAEVNITSLKDFDFFTHARVDGKKAPFVEPKDYWLDFKDGALTLNFTLPFKTPVKAKTLAFEIYDSSFFVDFAFAKDGAGTLAGTPPPACKVAVSSARDTSATPQKP
ncbi:MAG: DUF1007 family protein, partial [Rhizobiales bacterium]|nr:DUF1007 family protein [Hyphomicrobiales bacterium]